MSLMNIYSTTLDEIADAIRFRLKDQSEYYPREMPDAINNIVDDRMDWMFGVLNNEAFCGNRVIDLQYGFKDHNSLSGNAVCGSNVIYFQNAFYGCTSIGNAVCGPAVSNMHSAYYGCTGLKGSAACGNSVVDMSQAYYNCTGLEDPACGDGVVNMQNTYMNCSGLNNNAVCGDSVIDMYQTYRGCSSLTGNAVCGPAVNNMVMAYYGCTNLSTAYIGPSVENAAYAFYGCKNLITAPEIVGVDNLAYAFGTCTNLTHAPYVECNDASSMYFGCNNIKTSSTGKVQNGTNMFSGCRNLETDYIVSADDMSGMYANCKRVGVNKGGLELSTISGATYLTRTFYNSGKFAYITGLESVEPGFELSALTASGLFENCTYLETPISGEYLTKIDTMYSGTAVHGDFHVHNNVEYFSGCFSNRKPIIGEAYVRQLNIICDSHLMFRNIRDAVNGQQIVGKSIQWAYNSTWNTRVYNTYYNIYLYGPEPTPEELEILRQEETQTETN